MQIKNKLTIQDMLCCIFATGTQKSKEALRPPPAKKLRQIRDITFCSNAMKAKRRKAMGRDNDNCINDTETDIENDTHPNAPLQSPAYYDIYTAIKSVGLDVKGSEIVGYRLLAMRSEPTIREKSEETVRK